MGTYHWSRPCRHAKSGRRRCHPSGGRRRRWASTPRPAPASRCQVSPGTPARWATPRGLRDEQATLGGALRVVHGGVRLRHVAVGAAPRQRREDHPVGELELAHLVRRHQRDHLLRSLLHHLACLVALARRRAAAALQMRCNTAVPC